MSNNSLPLPEDLSLTPPAITYGASEAIDFTLGMDGRRIKAALVLATVWAIVFTIHAINGWWVVCIAALVLLPHAVKLLTARPAAPPVATDTLPSISLLVSAQNEESVVAQLAANLCRLDYPAELYEVWVIDDRSTDRTPQLLDELAQQYPQLRVLHRTTGSGGKSGALNQVLPLTFGELVGVFDADAQVEPAFLRPVASYFQRPQVGAIQLRKSVANANTNWLTKGQSIEMALDAYLQQQRITVGGVGELRGNGQFVRRQALADCGGWNEETITDDLDLTLRLHLNGWDIDLAGSPAVLEEGVTSIKALWHQRNRWAEGGYQRYLDYWRLVNTDRLGGKQWDLVALALMQYLLPSAVLPDLIGAVIWQQLPLLGPLTAIGLLLQTFGIVVGLRRVSQPGFSQVWLGLTYMLHWMVVMPAVTLRMAFRPKQLKWVKTLRQADQNPAN
jgi:1,2-diacylglycerol 3-beta-glucosyltransferase